MNQVNKDVQDIVNPADGTGTVVKPGEGGDDKEANFAELRKKLKEKEDEIARLKSGNRSDDVTPTFDLGDLPESHEKGADAVALRRVFERDLKEATLQWTQSNKVTPEQWAAIKKNVRLSGQETLTEIKNAIDREYHAIPSVREARETQIREEGKKEAMKQHFDDEVHIPGGGTTGGTRQGDTSGSRMPRDTRAWGKSLGLSDKELEAVDPNADSNQYTILDPAYKDR